MSKFIMKNFIVCCLISLLIGCVSNTDKVRYSKTSKVSEIGYSSVSEALNALKQKEDLEITVVRGWTIVNNENEHSLWSFTPVEHPAHPAVVKRTTVETDGSVYIKTRVLCQATKQECDKLVQEFQELNERAKEEIHGN